MVQIGHGTSITALVLRLAARIAGTDQNEIVLCEGPGFQRTSYAQLMGRNPVDRASVRYHAG